MRFTPAAGTTRTPEVTRTAALHGLRDKRVGIIGTGATAVQVVPHVAASAGELFVFQRTPSSIDVRANRPTDASWAASLEPGWQRERMENFTLLTSGGFAEQDLVMDGWTDIIGKLVTRLRDQSQGSGQDLATVLELADFEKMEQIRARVDDDRDGPGDRRGPQAVVSAVLQASLLPRRVPPGVQPAQRHPGRHGRARRRRASPPTASSSADGSTRSTA